MQIISPNENPVTISKNQIVAMVTRVDVNTLQTLEDISNQDEENTFIGSLETKKTSKKVKTKLDFDLSAADLSNSESKN